ncbi:MAG TPA: choice-of-anchor tandem repeat GloVer-containing protein [Terriglobales bacterium]|nr:choice-of-anchor tandem repeat GloVer-containing protein [Terriglobales bacterium]
MPNILQPDCEETPVWRSQAVNRLLVLAIVLVLLSVAPPVKAQTFKVLYDFTNGTDGGVANTTLVRDPAGNLYGTTEEGGDINSSNCNPPQGCGTIFKIDTHGKETVLYDFENSPDAAFPSAGLVRDQKGNLYGTTFLGGTSNNGAIFRLGTTGKETVLYSFTGGRDGGDPMASLILDSNGNLYGTTYTGGDLSCRVGEMNGCGVVFKLSKAGKLTVLHRFHGTDGADPLAGVVRDEAGNLYGTTTAGGSATCNGGCGTVFKLNQAGKETVLHTFTLGDGATPMRGSLIRDRAGNLYGTTQWGGDLSCGGGGIGCGTVFKLDKTGKETVLYKFKLGTDGGLPAGGLVRDPAGNFYGTTSLGGQLSCNGGDGCGTVFKLDKAGKETALYDFTNGSDGAFPEATLVRDPFGNLYGTTEGNLQNTWGSVFEVIP